MSRLNRKRIARRNSHDPKSLFRVAQLHHEDRKSKTAIARHLGVSVTQVARLLREAAHQGIVRVSVEAPRHAEVEAELSKRFALREVRVLAAARDEASVRSQLAQEAARLFMDVARPGAKIGIGSGRTMFEMVAALPQQATKVEVFPLALIADQSSEVRGVDAMTLVTTVWFKFRPDAHARRMTLLPGVPFDTLRTLRQELFDSRFMDGLETYFRSADAFFFSASHPRKDSQINDITDYLGIGVHGLRERGAVGDVLFRPVDASGAPVNIGIDPFVLGISLDALRTVSGDASKPVVLVAGGKQKLSIVLAGLKAHYFNTMITDDETAEALLRSG